MKIIRIKISKNASMLHRIHDMPSNSYSYAALLLLQDKYKELDIDFNPENDWRYLFIVKRTFLRHRKLNGKWVCHYCHRELYKMPERNKKSQNIKDCVTVDHKVAACKCDDILDSSNFLVSCSKCNNNKASKDYEVFVELKQQVEKISNSM